MDREKNNVIKELILLYVTENYKKHLESNNLKKIEEIDFTEFDTKQCGCHEHI